MRTWSHFASKAVKRFSYKIAFRQGAFSRECCWHEFVSSHLPSRTGLSVQAPVKRGGKTQVVRWFAGVPTATGTPPSEHSKVPGVRPAWDTPGCEPVQVHPSRTARCFQYRMYLPRLPASRRGIAAHQQIVRDEHWVPATCRTPGFSRPAPERIIATPVYEHSSRWYPGDPALREKGRGNNRRKTAPGVPLRRSASCW